MKTLFYIIFTLISIIGNAQQSWYKSSPMDYVWTYVGNAGFSDPGAVCESLVFGPSGEPYVAFCCQKASVMKFDGTNWVAVGNANFSVGFAQYTSLAFSPSGQPYVAYADGNGSHPASVMKFDGNNWVYVGNQGFSSAGVDNTSLAFSPAGEPYVAYSDWHYNGRATVMKFDGYAWVSVGNPGFSSSYAGYTCLAFNQSGQPYVAFEDNGNSSRATVMKFDGNSWVNVGIAGFSAGAANSTSLAFSPSDEPYVAYQDAGNSGKASVMKFDGNNWVIAGAGISADTVWYISLAFSPSGQPFVGYVTEADWMNSGKMTVIRFDGNSWVTVGNADFSAGSDRYTSLAFSPSGEAYVAFYESNNSYAASVMKFDSVFVGINEQHNSGISVYPNPSSNSITINFSNLSGNLSKIVIEDLKGKQMFEIQTRDSKIILDVGNYPAGMYFVKVKSKGSNWVGKFCKE